MPADLTRRKRSLGRYMETLRRHPSRDLTGEELAVRSETSQTTISRLESGKQLPGRHLFAAILNALGVTETERSEAFALWNRARVKTAMVEHPADLPSGYLAFRRDESEASAELTINYAALPGLLHTERYQRALAEANSWLVLQPTPGWEQRALDERHARQQLLRSAAPLHLHAVLSEAALRFTVGGPEVWAEQLAHLLTVGEQANITIQVVPFDRGAFASMSGPVIILRFDDDPETPHTVYLEHPAGGETIDKQPEVSSFVSMFDSVVESALPPSESADFIRTLLESTR